METTKVAFVGVGDISGIYLENLTKLFKQIEVVGLCDSIKGKSGTGSRALRHPQDLRHHVRCLRR